MRHNLLISTLSTLLFNTAIAGLLTVTGFEQSFRINFVFSQCIGLSIYSINATVMYRLADHRRRWLVLALTFPTSILLGISLALRITGVGDWNDPRIWMSMVIGLFFGGIGGIMYFFSERIERLDTELRQRRLTEMESEKRKVEAQLKMLQAQIEPHFLFNTLANVNSLIDSDPALAKKLLERLNDWLRVALVRARSDRATLGDEIDMLENYLQILKIRFGERLNWRIEVTDNARRTPFPPMLLQPLVENAVRHGIEPKLGGGEIAITANAENKILKISVRDNGVGLTDTSGAGTGLNNVRARLTALFGESGQLKLEVNAGGGAVAMLALPLKELSH
jgi:sensor histidine kinase YesM